MNKEISTTDQYRQSGVDIDAGNRAVALMKPAVQATYTSAVLAGVGSFGGLFALENLPDQPVLVASTDGVGTKVKLAAQLGSWQSIGHDLVNHCVNDILVQNARPLFFLDYIAASKLDPVAVAQVITGVADACRAVGCVLIGGETAEMPGVYTEGAFDLAGTIIGLVARDAILPDTAAMQPGDRLIGLPSSGPHTNGYSLIRRIIAHRNLDETLANGQTIAAALLTPHRCYRTEIDRLQEAGVRLHGMAHITGGGFTENIPRILPNSLAARINRNAWELPPIFRLLVEEGDVADSEAFRVFNMGIGMILVAPQTSEAAILHTLPEAIPLGDLIEHQPNQAQVIFTED